MSWMFPGRLRIPEKALFLSSEKVGSLRAFLLMKPDFLMEPSRECFQHDRCFHDTRM